MTIKKKHVFEIFITLIFFAASLYFIAKKDLKVDAGLSVYIEGSRKDVVRLYIDKEKPLKEKVSKRLRRIDFDLPGQEIKNLRLVLGEKPGSFTIKRIAVKTPFKHREWSGKVLKRVFKISGTKFRGNIRTKDDAFHVRSRKGGTILPLQEDIAAVINELSGEKTFFYLIALFLSVVFFYFVHSLNPKNLRIFFTRKTALNMVLIFIIIIFFPLVDDLIDATGDENVHSLQEKRVKADKPSFRFDSLFTFLRRYRYYYNDHFGPRSLLIPLHNYIKVKAFGISPIPMVTIGKDGWLYLARQNRQVGEIEYYRSLEPFTKEELEQWRTVLEQRRDYLARRGIHYLFVIAPNKSTIYPEYLPDSIRPVHKQSRLDQLVAYVKTHSDVSILDLRDVMFAGKKERRVYRKTDSHWNRYGAYLAYAEIMKSLSRFFKDARAMPISAFEITEKERHGGDLAIMLSLQNNIFRDSVIDVTYKRPAAAQEGKPLKRQYPGVNQSVIENPGGTLPTALMVHDSFANRFKVFLSEHFRRIIYLRDWNLNFYPDLIKKEKPGVVIDEMAERFLLEKAPSLPPKR